MDARTISKLAYKLGCDLAAQEAGFASYEAFSKSAEDEGVAHGATTSPDQDGMSNHDYREQNISDAIDRSFEAYQQYIEDPSAMTQPGLLHGAINYWNRGPVASPEQVAPPLYTSPTTGA